MAEVLYNRFKLLKKCGSGGTGEVYEALDLRLKRKVALKRARRDSRGGRRQRAGPLLKEAEHLGTVHHSNVVMIHDVIEREDSVTLVLELVDGIPFQELYRKEAIAEPELVGYLRQIVAALEWVHSFGVIHRDVNPRNVLVTPEGLVKLTDFGLAASVSDAEPRPGGTVGYMAPEALRRKRKVGPGVDIYGLGMIAYQGLLGMPAFQQLYGTQNSITWARWLLSREKFRTLRELEAPVSEGLSALVARMLEKDPQQRYARMAEVRRDLESLGTTKALAPASGPSLGAAVRRLLPSILARLQDRK